MKKFAIALTAMLAANAVFADTIDDNLDKARRYLALDPTNDNAYPVYKQAFDAKLWQVYQATKIEDQKQFILEHCEDFKDNNKTCDAIKDAKPELINEKFIVVRGARMMEDEAAKVREIVTRGF